MIWDLFPACQNVDGFGLLFLQDFDILENARETIGWILRGAARLRWKTPKNAWFVVREMACWSWM
jgi:hypothetical protein